MVSRVGLSPFRVAVLTGASRQSQPPSVSFTGTSLGGRLDPIQSPLAQDLKSSKAVHSCRRPSLPLRDLFSSKHLSENVHSLFLDSWRSELKVHVHFGLIVIFHALLPQCNIEQTYKHSFRKLGITTQPNYNRPCKINTFKILFFTFSTFPKSKYKCEDNRHPCYY